MDALELERTDLFFVCVLQLTPTRIVINRRRLLSGCQTGGVSLALNGRTGRRVACVLDSSGTQLESFDLEGEGEDMEVADDGRTD